MMRRYTLYNIYKATRGLMLAMCLLMAGSITSWGQQNPPDKLSWDGVQAILEDLEGDGNVPVVEFMSLVNSGKIVLKNGSVEENIRYEEGNNRWVYDIKWSYEEITAISLEWPEGVKNYPNNYSISMSSDVSGNSKKVIYAKPGESKTLHFQDGGGAENIDGFISWYVSDENGSNQGNTNLTWGSTIAGRDQDKALVFSNCLAWLRGTHTGSQKKFTLCLYYPRRSGNSWRADESWTKWDNGESSTKIDYSPTSVSKINYTVPSTEGVYYVVCEGSSNNNISVNRSTITPPKIAVKTIYEIHVIKDARTTQTLSDNVTIPVTDAIQMSAFKEKFLESYEIHTPIETGTNYRLAEPLENYYIPDGTINTITSPDKVIWTAYDSNGAKINNLEGTGEQTSSITKITFPYASTTSRYTYYLIAEVAKGDGTKYPVSFLTVYLEPFSNPLIASSLDPNSERSEAYLERERDKKYRKITGISFDENADSQLEIENNYLQSIPNEVEESYYAFANPADYQHRKANRLSTGRGEYAFYRTLNYPNVSTQNQGYNDYFMQSGNYQNVQMVDRTKEKGGGFGHFLYLDATDEPGVITKIDVGQLCKYTTLIVSAWVCDMVYLDSGAEKADVGFTFKRKESDGTEKILSKFYSGVVGRATTTIDGEQVAQWKQVFFKFTISDATATDKYILEIANNTPSSNGADYGIDDIQLWCTLPNIEVERKDACDASTLYVSSDYETLLNNMGWEKGEDVVTKEDLADREFRKYRYGLMGNDPYEDELDKIAHTKIGNVYYSFAYIDNKGNGSLAEDWVTIRKDLLNSPNLLKHGLERTMRVFIPTDLETNTYEGQEFPTDPSDVNQLDIILNVRALNDFIADTERGPKEGTETYWPKDEINTYFGDKYKDYTNGFTEFVELCLDEFCDFDTEPTVGHHTITKVHWEKIDQNDESQKIEGKKLGDLYRQCLQDMYDFLAIPRVHCPWISLDKKTIYLSSIDVDNTDLRYRGEKNPAAPDQPYDGKYWVVLFSAEQVVGKNHEEDGAGGTVPKAPVVLSDDCTLKSEFTVQPSTTILIETKAGAETALCAGALRKVTATLSGYDVDGDPVVLAEKGIKYIFDWYLGTEQDYLSEAMINDKDTVFVDEILKKYRRDQNDRGVITVEKVTNWSNGTEAEKEKLLSLLDNELLRMGIEGATTFDLIVNTDEVIAMPYVYEDNTQGLYEFCTNWTKVDFDLSRETLPIAYTGLPNIQYPQGFGSAPLRLGLRHLEVDNTTTFSIPIRKGGLEMSEGATHIGVKADVTTNVLLNDGSAAELPFVGTVNSLSMGKNEDEGEIEITWSDDALKKMFEGGEYELLIPFVQFNGDALLGTACDGFIALTIKVVPEYLTWKGNADAVWDNDDNWDQSTEAELYMDNKATDVDANGSDLITNAFSPLYFTKITIDPTKTGQSGELILNPQFAAENVAIKYDMAMDTVSTGWTIKSYYINKVSEIYFKPNATLMNQHLLIYDTARVEFSLTQSTPYWMASPLKAVYAGDMYAPIGNGKQETPAFNYITFDYSENGTNHRWELPFYQKAWDKAVAYSNVENPYGTITADGAVTNVTAVKSNWSIEYNDVWVPYSIGKGFYMRVEENSATVRLPKADKEYTYQSYPTTRAGLSLVSAERDSSGRLANGEDIVITLTSDSIDGDGDHFLVGNPYMTYLNMKQFFTVNNTNLNKKYWTIEGGTTKAVVGTPDVEWTGNETESETISGFIPPMTAFFVERAGYQESEKTTKAEGDATGSTTISVKFTTGMMATKADATAAPPATRSVSATSPVLTLTADRDGKKGRSVITLRDKASNAYQPQEDAVVLLDSELDAPVAYSVAGNRAAQVNALRSIDNIPVGVYNSRKGDVTVTIEGMDQLAEPLYLYDAYTRKSTLLEGDSHALEISGESHGRYYLRSSAIGSVGDNAIAVYSVQSGKVIVSSTQEVRNIKVYSLSGAMVKNYMNLNTTQYTFNLPAGVYVVHAEGKDGTVKVEKVIVR